MKQVEVKVRNFSQSLPLPSYATDGSDGMDVMACFDAKDEEGYAPFRRYREKDEFYDINNILDHKRMALAPGQRALVPTGLKVEIPEGYRIHVTPRSGFALKSGITILNSPGKIDSDYRGWLGVILINTSSSAIWINHGDRIAQIAIEESIRVKWQTTDSLNDTERGKNGFGSSGMK